MTEKRIIRFDWAIKTLLRDKANFDILEGFLTALLKEEIRVVSLLESESNSFRGGTTKVQSGGPTGEGFSRPSFNY